MACNSCSKSFSLLRPEKGCPSCGFSYCSKCLNHKTYLQKANTEVKVCAKCSQTINDNKPSKIEPPDAYYRRISAMDPSLKNNGGCENKVEKEIRERLKQLKNENKSTVKASNEDITARLQKLKGEMPSTSDAELVTRLANIKGVPVSAVQSKPVLLKPDVRTEQEQADELMKQYMDHANIDTKYKDEFDGLVSDIEARLQKLKGNTEQDKLPTDDCDDQSENEEELIKNIIEQAKSKAKLEESEISESTTDELPFCEICNEDARMRCLGCKYLFCKRCFIDHKDDDDGCNRYESYTAPKN